MADKETELAKQVERLAAGVASLRTTVMIGFAALGVLVVTGFANRGLMIVLAMAGITLMVVVYLTASLGAFLGRRLRKTREQRAAHGVDR